MKRGIKKMNGSTTIQFIQPNFCMVPHDITYYDVLYQFYETVRLIT